jgi:hypothetical protein
LKAILSEFESRLLELRQPVADRAGDQGITVLPVDDVTYPASNSR